MALAAILRPRCSIVAFTIELIHHSWETIPVECFKYSSSSLATDNMVRYGVQPRFLEVYTGRASIYMNKVLMVWQGSSSYLSHRDYCFCLTFTKLGQVGFDGFDDFDDLYRPGCSIVAFTIELIHHSWDTIPVEGFKYIVARL
ncbi:hypothetical protein LOTGIDRAFT_157067 [Lottia gigantea]|uniref:Uncharacterized protein n=1 Tax=Lottia gigantea TaxID=225164 RepID=V4B8A7_LOTGI|nr:hypothetical protein LOTGIDRAFT_157067 [Lottia gigantea]ESP01937.1 hypothetical protein LOTGIDRAFT_157067 [Lottia gigantea]